MAIPQAESHPMKFIETYNLIDLFVAGTLLVSLTLGLWKGFIRSLAAMAGVVFGVLGAMKYHSYVQPYLGKVSSLDPHISVILAMVIVFILVQVLFVLIRKLLDMLIDVTRLSWLDRALGAGMGAVAGFLVAASAVQAVMIAVPEWPLIKTSRLAQPVDALAHKAMTYAPKEARDQFQQLMAKWKGTQEPPKQLPAPRSVASETNAAPPPGPVK